MVNIKKIVEFTQLVEATLEKINAIQFNLYTGYDFRHQNGGTVNYVLGFMEGDDFKPIQNGTCEIPYVGIIENWGEDDDIIFDYVIGEKGFTKISV